MKRKALIAILIILVITIGGGAWYYINKVQHTRIEKLLKNPTAYKGEATVIEGEVKDRTSFFIVVKFYKLKDKSGEIIVVTKKTLPEVGSIVRVKGRVDDAFTIGDQKLLVFMEESLEQKTGKSKEAT